MIQDIHCHVHCAHVLAQAHDSSTPSPEFKGTAPGKTRTHRFGALRLGLAGLV